jgi:hypothetical protein
MADRPAKDAPLEQLEVAAKATRKRGQQGWPTSMPSVSTPLRISPHQLARASPDCVIDRRSGQIEPGQWTFGCC